MAQTPPAAVEACVTDSAAPTTVRATVVQAATVFYDTAATLCKAEKLLAEAAALGSQIVVFPEAFIGGYPRGSVFASNSNGPITNGVEQFSKYVAAAIQVPGPEVERLAALAGKHKVFLVMGAIEREGYTLYCTVVYFSPEGEYLGKHRKLIPTGLERMVWGFGDGSNIPVFDSKVGKVGAVICMENKMPLLRTAMYGKGIEIYCAPTADDGRLWQSTVTHIAVEGGCFVLSANQFCLRKDYPPAPAYYFGNPQKDDFSPDSVVCEGGSVIISPLGKILAGPNYEGEGLLTAYLDLGDIAKAKYGFDVVGHFSKPEVLRLTVDERHMKPVSFTSTHPTEKAA